MARVRVACAGGCDRGVWAGGRGCLPIGQATCRDCRAVAKAERTTACIVCDVILPLTTKSKTCSAACLSVTRSRVMQQVVEQRVAAGALGPRTRCCEVCGVDYRYSYAAQRTCGRACGLELKRRTPRVANCAGCGNSYAMNAMSQSYCSPGCRPSRRPRAAELQCVECSRPFLRTKRAQKSCSAECAALRKRRIDLVRYGKTPDQVDLCKCCGSKKAAGRRRYCASCAARLVREQMRSERRRRRARERRAATEPFTLTEIAERDRFVCGICRKRVDMTRTVPHPRAPTIDHLIPLSAGGDDLKTNVQIAHFLCNSTRGTGGTVQLLLIG